MQKKQLLIGLLIVLLYCIFPLKSNATSSNLYLNNLNFDATINKDGSMNMTEIWNIEIEDTNTLFKTFKIDNKKYSGITDVKVTDITNNTNQTFTKIDSYMYHVTKNCYYGLKNSDGDFEIAWGVGLEDKTATKTYKIEYKIKDVISKYNDYAELYWQFVGNDFEISSKNIKGTIMLPGKVSNKEKIKVWGHSKDLNGTIYATDLNKIEFQMNNVRSGRFVEIRVLFPTSLIANTNRTYSSDILEKAIAEETKWANDANKQREMKKQTINAMIIGGIALAIIGAIYFATKIKKYKLVLKDLKKYEPTNKLEYYRELPDEKATPGEAVFLLKGLYESFETEFGKIFSSTILDLTLKKYIDLKVDENEKGKKAIQIINLNKEITDLKDEEKELLEFLLKAIGNEESITMNKLEQYISKHPSVIEQLITKTHKNVKKSMIQNGYFNDKEYKKYNEYLGYMVLYIVGAVLLFFLLPLSIVFIINAIYCGKIQNRINVLTQTGLDQKEKWKGLKKYMEDFSLLKEKEVPALVLWEKYLVYATVFGISEKVLKQLKIVYPNIDELDGINTSAYLYFMYHSNFNTNFSNVINSSIASATYSSGSGSGGGFSGGGGFGGRCRRRRRQIKINIMHSRKKVYKSILQNEV